jgi:formylglycine-generating enzyme required for sulfatase activity
LKTFDAGRSRSAAEAWKDWTTRVDGDGSPLLLGGTGGCQPWEWTDEAHGITWVELCGGSFTMGSPASEPGHGNDERQHQVTLSRFAIARTETTNSQYQRVHADHQAKDDLPVASVDWQQALDFCRAVGGDLPTEAQWEYAARAGTTTAWSFGDDEAALGEHAWYDKNADGKPHPVAQKQPNPWGLYDMHGNLWEWVADRYGSYPEGAQTDPAGPQDGVYRVLRGGSFGDWAVVTRSASRIRGDPEDRNVNDGFRCARAPRRQP